MSLQESPSSFQAERSPLCATADDGIKEGGLMRNTRLSAFCRPRRSWLVTGFLLGLSAMPALAHRITPTSSSSGLSLPSVTHGQMAVLEDYRAAVMDLAAAQYPTDEDMRRIQSFIALQHFACAWGWIPGGVSNENSPFNECTHAYLAGIRQLLLHLETMSGDRSAVRAVRAKIDIDMARNRASLVLCRFSDEPFNTADVIIPRASGILTDPASLTALAVVALLAAACGWSAAWLKRFLRDEVSPGIGNAAAKASPR